jgi:Transposase DDE domain
MKAQETLRRKRRRQQRSLIEILREFLTPALWKQAHQARRRAQKREAARWFAQPLVLMLLLMTWSHGDSQAERFECAKAYCRVCLHKRRNPGKTVQGFQKALARLPMAVLRVLAAGVRGLLASHLADHWRVEGFVPIGCDGSRVECPRTTELEEHLGQAGKKGSAPTLWVTALVHLRWGVPWAWRFGKGTASERDHLIRLLDVLPRLALLVADAGYFGFRLAEQLVRQDVMFLLRMSSNVTLYTCQRVRLERYREGEVYYWPAQKERKAGAVALCLRLIRIRAKHHRHDVWLLTNVLDKKRLSHTLAGKMYRWRWQNEGCFRTYKRTLKKVKLVSRTVGLVHREAEGSWLALQLLLAQGVLAQTRRTAKPAQGGASVGECEQEVKCSPSKILMAIRDEIHSAPRPRRLKYEHRLREAQAERRERTSAKASRVWPRRKPHKPPKPPKLRELSVAQKRELASPRVKAA